MKAIKTLVLCAVLTTAVVFSPQATQAQVADLTQQQIDTLKQQIAALQALVIQLLALQSGGTVTTPVATTTTPVVSSAPSPKDGVVFKAATSSQVVFVANSTSTRFNNANAQYAFGGNPSIYECTVPAGESRCPVTFEYDVSSTSYKWRYVTIERASGFSVMFNGRAYTEPSIGSNFPKKGILKYTVAYNEDVRQNNYGFSIKLEPPEGSYRSKTYGHTIVIVKCAPGTQWSGEVCQTSLLELTSGVVDEVIDPTQRTTSAVNSRKVCYIPFGDSTCTVGVNWQIGDAEQGEKGSGNLVLQSVRTLADRPYPEFVHRFTVVSDSAGMQAITLKGPPQTYQLHVSEETPSKDGYANGMIFLKSSGSIAVACKAPYVWNFNKGVCDVDTNVSTTPGAQTVPQGTFTTNSPCVVPLGKSTCQLSITWSGQQSAEGYSVRVVGSGAVISTSLRENNFPYTLTYNPNGAAVGAYTGSAELVRREVQFRCATGSSWNGQICAAGSTTTTPAQTTTTSTKDEVKPSVVINSVNPFVVSGTSTISVTATDAGGIDTVKLYIGGILIGTDTTAPYEFNFNNRSRYASGTSAFVSVIATDKAGNQTLVRTSAKVTR